ncbi:hypothetical protein H9P43_007990 [Blastocladiella emersonii ATCC 22665]|nr:hypothetical protein H9P43_007990 [Blastocladiella emersonii ATCC 22665]
MTSTKTPNDTPVATTAGPRSITGWAAQSKGAPLTIWSYDAPALGPDEVDIKVLACGVCHSDIHTIDSGWGEATYPVVVGHEIVGIVAAVGPHVTNVRVGDRVAVGAMCGSCGGCGHCQRGHEPVCAHRVFTYDAKHANGRAAYGGYAEAVRVPCQFTFHVPEALDSAECAPLLCAGATVYAPLKRYMTPGARVGVVGIGGLGHLALQFAKALGAAEVVAVSTSTRKKEDAGKLGASQFVVLDSPAAFKAHEQSLDVIICTACSHEMPWNQYLDLVAPNGTFVVVGIPEQEISVDLKRLVFWQRALAGSIIAGRPDIQEMLEVAAKTGVRPWIERIPMAKCNEAIDRMRRNDVRYRFVLEN